MKESYLKFLNLDFNGLNEQDLDHLLYLYFDGKLDIEEDLFYKNYELFLNSFIKNNLELLSDNKKELSNKIGYYIFCLYGKEKFEKYLTDLNLKQFKFKQFALYVPNTKTEKEKLPIHMQKLYDYYHYQVLKEKYKNIDETKMKEAFEIIFCVDNSTEKWQSIQRKKAFMEREKINDKTFKDYIYIYGFAHTLLKGEVLEHYFIKYSSYYSSGINLRNFELNTFDEDYWKNLNGVKDRDLQLELLINSILCINNLNELKEFIYNNHISETAIHLTYNNQYIKGKYSNKKEEIIEKVKQANIELEKEYKYTSVSKIISMIEKTNDEELIYKIINSNDKYRVNYKIRDFIAHYRLLQSKQERDQIEKELNTKINKALQRIKEEKKKEKNQPLDDKILKEFHQLLEEDNLTLKDFSKKNGFSYSKTLICFKKLQNDNPDLYHKIKSHIDDPKRQKFKVILEKINKICDEIIHGIDLEDGTKREFDILDYYSKTRVNIDDFSKLYPKSGNFSVEDRRKIVQFLQKNKSNMYFNINQELDSKTILLVHGEMHEVTKDEKLSTIEYLKSKNLPLYYAVYSVALRRYLNGILFDKKENKLKVLKNSGSK